MKKRSLACLALTLAACGGQQGSLPLAILVSALDDPFFDARKVRVTIGSQPPEITDVVDGHFDLSVELEPMDERGQVVVELIDGQDQVFAYGKTPAFQITASTFDEVVIWVGRKGRAAPARTALPTPRTEMTAVSIPAVGVLFSGGRDSSGITLADSAVYRIQHDLIATSNMREPRASANSMGLSRFALVVGGSAANGLGQTANPLATAELFDPTSGLGVWSPVTTEGFLPRSRADLTILPSGTGFISGGVDQNGAPLSQGAFIPPDGTPRVAIVATPMVAARAGHAVGRAKFADGDGAILVGGLTPGSVSPVAERLIGQAFETYNIAGATNLHSATASTLNSGDVIILGGRPDNGVSTANGIAVTPLTGAVRPIPQALSAARSGHTATVLGDGNLLVCGGADQNGVLQASCDLLDGTTAARLATPPLSLGRRGHVAVTLETGEVLLAGGVDQSGQPVALIELYTP